MRKQKITTHEYVFTKEEAELIDVCLGYCYHRLISTDTSGIHKTGVKKGQVEALRLQIREALK